MVLLNIDEALIGREQERRDLERAASAAAEGRGALILVSGEAGIGKTSLVRQAVEASGLLLLEGRAYQGMPLPYGPLDMALREQRVSGFDGLRAMERLADGRPFEPEPGPMERDRAAQFEALRTGMVEIAGRQPVALFLDDLHWADHATLELLPALAGALERTRLLIIGAYRNDEIARGHPLRRLRAELRRAGRLREIAIEPLSAAQTARLVEQVLGAKPGPALAAALYDRTEGVPFFVRELAGELATGERLSRSLEGLTLETDDALPLPESVRDLVGLQTEGLDNRARRLLDVAAVAGQEFSLEMVMAVAQGSEAGLSTLLERGLLSESGEAWAAFRHALTWEACYLDIPWSQRRAIHRELATYLEAIGETPAIVAEHWLAGREQERARKALIAAAELSCRAHAYRDAGVALRRALELWPDGVEEPERRDMLERQGMCAELSGDVAEAIRAWRETASAHQQAGDRRKLAAAESRLAGVYELRGDWERALAAREASATAFAAEGDFGRSATERLLAAVHLRTAACNSAALAQIEAAKPEAERSGRIDLQARLLGLEGNVRARLGDTTTGVEMVRGALALALAHELTGAVAEIYHRLADALEHVGDYAGAQDAYYGAYAYCEAHEIQPTGKLCMACLSVVLRQIGEWGQALDVCRDVLADANSNQHAQAAAGSTIGLLHALGGNARSARPLLVEAVAVARRVKLSAAEMLAIWGLAIVDDLSGRPDAAVGRCRDLLERWEHTEDVHFVLPALRWAVTLCAERGAEAETRACAAALARIAADSGQVEALATLAHALGETSLLDGSPEQAVAQFIQSLDLLRDVQAPFDRALTERRAGNALAVVGQREAAVERLVSGYRMAQKLGARPLAEQITRDLAALGEPIEQHLGRRAAERMAYAGLSRRELEVLRQVSVGRTSREIGQQLFISPRTVEMHVQSILAKLDCRSRAEATRKAGEMGLLG